VKLFPVGAYHRVLQLEALTESMGDPFFEFLTVTVHGRGVGHEHYPFASGKFGDRLHKDVQRFGSYLDPAHTDRVQFPIRVGGRQGLAQGVKVGGVGAGEVVSGGHAGVFSSRFFSRLHAG
jgi:hypothetical protein